MGSTRRKVTEQFTIYCPPVHALLYAFFILRKIIQSFKHGLYPTDFQWKSVWSFAFSNIHTARSYFYRLLPDFEAVSRCEGLLSPPLQAFTARVNVLKSNPSHQKPLKIRMKHALCEGGECFLGEINTYIRAGKGHSQNRWRLIQHDRTASLVRPDVTWSPFTTRRLVRTTPGLVRTTPWVGKTTPGLVGTNSGLVEKAYHHFFTSETSVIYNLQLCLRPWSQEYCIVLYDGRQT